MIYPSPKQALVFTCLQYMSFENTVAKGEIARNEQFLLFPQCFSTCFEGFLPFSTNLKLLCKLFQNSKSLKFVVWERVKKCIEDQMYTDNYFLRTLIHPMNSVKK